ncbi:MFS transporter [Amycolatopsis pithecellobii]|uniref:MFS transporter n=1 Tax=Amycolatopsis pithecellobii TaxID=664692 RepID=A0A6N7YY47_9PSEU|nr:MFS transporter [Amycolatopsis pithecellobii]MTD53279.1 MFS transporter [Amycolatopsis pithecellobii]
MSATSHLTAAGEFRHHWRALTAATIGVATGVAVLPFYTNGLVIPSLQAEFGWSRSELSSVQLIGSLVTIVTAPLAGVLVDRLGVRVPAVFSLAAMGVAYFVLATSGPAFGWYLLGFVLMYVLAAASTAVSFTRTINERFDRARGLALGIALCGAGLVAFLIPLVLGPVLAQEWRTGYRILGVLGLISATAVLLLMPRGRPATVTRGPRPKIGHLLRGKLFARLTIAFLALSVAVGGMTVHLVPLLRDAGASAGAAARTASIIGIALIVGRVAVGLLVDRFFAPRIAAAVLVFAAAAFVALALAGSALAPVAAIGIGLALGAEVDVIGYLTSRYYGLAHYSRMFGVFYAVFTLGLGASPLLMAWLRAATGSYLAALLVSAGLLAGASALLLTAPRFPTTAKENVRHALTEPTAP